MGIRFSKQIKLGNLVKLNLSKSGVSVSAGKKGASINLGKNGTYLNLSPTLLGIKGTGLSYRQKVTGGYGDVVKKVLNKEDNKTSKSSKKIEDNSKKDEKVVVDTKIIDEYNEALNNRLNLQKECSKVFTKEEFDSKINNFESSASKDIYQMYIDGDEDVIESSIGAYLNELDLGFDVKANYELEDHDLYIDLDLPEIEAFNDEYPCLVKNEVVSKKKTTGEIREEYAKTILGLGIYLTSNFFNVSSYIEKVIISAFTSRRNKDGDLKDEYLYSVKFIRNIFENTDFKSIDDSYQFILEFENRINLSSTYSFKSIKPFETENSIKANSLLDDALLALKEFGYKKTDIDLILPKLNETKLNSSSEYLKEALKLLSGK